MRSLAVLAAVSTAVCVSAGSWVSMDVPDGLLPAGSAEESPPGSGVWTVRGAGDDIWGSEDSFQFLRWDVPIEGDFSIGCRVVSLEDTPSAWGKAGLMVRVGCCALQGGESYAMAMVSTGSGAVLQLRDEPGSEARWPEGGTSAGAHFGPAATLLKLIRIGDTVSAYAAPDLPGLVHPLWVSLGTYDFEYLLEQPLYVGLAVTAHNADLTQDAVATAVFDSINLTDELVSTAGPTDFACLSDAGTIRLSWRNQAIYEDIALVRENLADGSVALLEPGPAPDAESYEDMPPAGGTWRYWLAAVRDGLPCAAQLCVAGAWASADIADSGLPGTLTVREDSLTVTGSGHDIGSGADDFRFVWREFPAESQVVFQARFDRFDNTGNKWANVQEWAKAGIMFRTDATQGSPFVMAGLRPDMDNSHDRFVLFREEPELRARLDRTFTEEDDLTLPVWLRVTYANGTVTAALALDVAGRPGAWSDFEARQLPTDLSPTVMGGFAVTSASNWMRVTAAVSKITVVTGEATFVRGDANADGEINVSDATYTLRYFFKRDRVPPCDDALDSNDDGVIDMSDVVYSLYYMFLDGPAIKPPLGACGLDPTDDGLTCAAFPPCGR